MKIYAISDLHLTNKTNFQALQDLPSYPNDWLIIAGDVVEFEDHLKMALILLTSRFKKVIWVPGNHDLWSLPIDCHKQKGEEKYNRLVKICHDFGVITPEDPYEIWEYKEQSFLLVPLLLLYDFSFRPQHIPYEKAVDWAAETGVICTDEELLSPEPYHSVSDWCHHRYQYSEKRLIEASSKNLPIILINHFPLRQDLAQLKRFPRFSLWCGTKKTENWHTRFPVSIVVYGHMHIRGTHYRDGVRFEEVSLGYPRDWIHKRGIQYYLREIVVGTN